jgi:hypothetical protein
MNTQFRRISADVRPLLRVRLLLAALGAAALAACSDEPDTPEYRETLASLRSCVGLVANPRPIADDRADRFLGKVQEATARCRGGERAAAAVRTGTPWLDWPHYWAAGDGVTRSARYDERWSERLGRLFENLHVHPDIRGIDGALVDLEYERVELIKFNLFDNYTYESYVRGGPGVDGRTLKVWDEMRLPAGHASYAAVGGDGQQACTGELIRRRTLTGICNDVFNPLMGSSNTLFARNVEFSQVFPVEGRNELTANRHGDRLNLMTPDPQVVSRALFTRQQSTPERCNGGLGLPNEDPNAACDYLPAPFFNVLAAFWIQFMTHDWFSHLREGQNADAPAQSAGCSGEAAAATGCRTNDAFRRALVVDRAPANRRCEPGGPDARARRLPGEPRHPPRLHPAAGLPVAGALLQRRAGHRQVAPPEGPVPELPGGGRDRLPGR